MVHTLRLDNYTPIPRKLVLGTNSSFGTESIKIERGTGWDGLNLTATWHIPGREEPLRVALLDGDAMDVPPEVTKEAKDGVLVLAGLASGVQRASCNVEYLILEQAGVYGGADAEPTPELAAQVLEATMQAKASANKAQQAAENAAADAAKAGPYAKAALAAKEAAEEASDGARSAARDALTAQDNAESEAKKAADSATAAADSAASIVGAQEASAASAAAAKKSADDAAAAASAVGAAFYGVDFSGSTSAGTRTGAAAEFVFTPGTDTSAGQNDFDGAYPWAGMRRCCCTLNADGTVTVNAYKGQPGYIEDGTNGEVLVEVPLFYVSGVLDVNPRVSAVPMPGFRAPKKFQNADGSLKQKCYLPAFPGSIGADGKLHSIAGVVSTGNKTISQFLAAARLWGETYCINTSADFEVLAYLMIVVYGTRNVQSKINGCVSLYATNIAVAGARTNESAVTVAKNTLEPGMVISIGTGDENERVANRRIVTAIEAIEGDTANVKASFTGEAVTTTTDHKIWRIMQSTGTANSVISTCGSPVSNTDGKHSFVFYGVENPLYGNQWRFECDWKLIDGVVYYCDDPTKYQWSSAADYLKLDTLALPGEGWATALQVDERVPQLQITKSVGGSASTYLADYFWVNKSGTRMVLRGGYSDVGSGAGPWCVYLRNGPGGAWWLCSADLSIPG